MEFGGAEGASVSVRADLRLLASCLLAQRQGHQLYRLEHRVPQGVGGRAHSEEVCGSLVVGILRSGGLS